MLTRVTYIRVQLLHSLNTENNITYLVALTVGINISQGKTIVAVKKSDIEILYHEFD